jgi:hypothetical protein
VLRPQRFLQDGQILLAEGLSLGIAPLSVVEHRQVVEALSDIRVAGPERVLADGQGALEEGLGCRIFTGFIGNQAPGIQIFGQFQIRRGNGFQHG